MKRNSRLMSKAISLLLALTMLLSLASTTIAAEAAEENGATSYLSGAGLQGIGGDGDTQLFGGGFAGWGLKSLGSGAISGLTGIGLNLAYKKIFGDDTDRILAAIAKLSEKMTEIDAKLDSMIQKMEVIGIQAFLIRYRDRIAPYKALFKDMQTAKTLYGGSDEDSIANKKEFLLDIYYGTYPSLARNNMNIMGIVRELKSILVDTVQVINGKTCNVFGAFDMLEMKTNLWEHQGYDSRNQFRNLALGVFTDFKALAELSIAEVIADCKANGKSLRQAELAETNLQDHIDAVAAMEKKCRVIQHPDLRIIRTLDGNGNLYAFYKDVNVASVRNLSDLECDMGLYQPTHHYIHCMVTTKNIKSMTFNGNVEKDYSYNIISDQATKIQIRDIHWLYGNTGGRKEKYEKTLYDILFDEKEGNFNNVGKLPKGTYFATNQYWYYSYSSNPLFGKEKKHSRWDTELVSDGNGKKISWVEGRRLLRITSAYNYKYPSVDHYESNKFFSLVTYNGYIAQGALEAPGMLEPTDGLISGMEASYVLPANSAINLSVEEKEGASYQWLVDKNDDKGFVEIENEVGFAYTIPSINPSMNGWRYQCAITEEEVSEWGEGYTITDPVTLNLTGEGVPAPVTEHDVSNAAELTAALEKESDGSWDGHTIKLTADIIYPNPISLLEHSVTIDLNGHTLTVQPSSDSEANINPMSNMAKTAAIYTIRGNLYVKGEGALNVIAGQGIDYGAYAYASEITVNNITCTDGGTSVYATDGGSVEITGDVSAKGENTYAIECFGGSTVKVSGNMSAEGHTSCGVYAESYTGQEALVEVGGDVIVSGDNSQAAFLNADYTVLKVQGNVTVTGAGASGISAGGGEADNRCTAIIYGDINAPMDAVNAWDSADVRVHGNITVTDEGATAVSAVGAMVQLHGNVTSKGKDGTGISVSAWDLVDPVVGAMVKADGKITAFTPLRMKGMPVEESEHIAESPYAGYYAFTDGTNTIWAKPGSFIKIVVSGSDSDPTPNPQTGDSSNMVLYALMLFSGAGIITIRLYRRKRRIVN